MWLLNRGGRCVADCMLLAGWLTAIGSALRCVPALIPTLGGAHPMAWVHAGSILNGLSGPLVGGSCSAVAACWFAPVSSYTNDGFQLILSIEKRRFSNDF